jgi:MOSC domain-containing protein YiiM
VELIVRRPTEGERELLEEAELDLDEGLAGDRWRTSGGSANKDTQLTLMNARVVDLVAAGDRQRWALAGDQLYVDFDISEANLPAGTRLALGAAVIEVTAEPHTGCVKFSSRFGNAAHRFVNTKPHRHLHLRGINARVVEPGTIRRGDAIRKV